MSKKTILSTIFVIALVLVAGMGINKSVNNDVKFSALALNDIEALAQESGEDFVITCGRYQGFTHNITNLYNQNPSHYL